jgi:hypothetical protein
MCAGEWLYFNFNAASLNTSASYSPNSRRQLTQARLSKARELEVSEPDAKGKTTHGVDAIHLSVHVWRYSGSFYVRLAHGYAPIKLVPPFSYLGAGDTDLTVNICDIGGKDGKAPETAFVGVLGNNGCSLLDVVAHTYIGGNCTETRSFAEVDDTEGALEMELEHYTHASCSPGGYTDLFVTFTEAHAKDNILFEVEHLGDSSDSTALKVRSLSLLVFCRIFKTLPCSQQNRFISSLVRYHLTGRPNEGPSEPPTECTPWPFPVLMSCLASTS